MDMTTKAQAKKEKKSKNKQVELQTKELLHDKRNDQQIEKAACGMGKNI